jgi:nesprin-1
VEHIQEELGRLGLMSATESEKVSTLLYTARQLDVQVSEELEGSVLLREKLQAIHKGLARVKRNHERASSVLDQCEASEKLGSDVVEQAVINCQVCNCFLLSVHLPSNFFLFQNVKPLFEHTCLF